MRKVEVVYTLGDDIPAFKGLMDVSDRLWGAFVDDYDEDEGAEEEEDGKVLEAVEARFGAFFAELRQLADKHKVEIAADWGSYYRDPY